MIRACPTLRVQGVDNSMLLNICVVLCTKTELKFQSNIPFSCGWSLTYTGHGGSERGVGRNARCTCNNVRVNSLPVQ